jgi:hypothetical protein
MGSASAITGFAIARIVVGDGRVLCPNSQPDLDFFSSVGPC